VIRAAPDGRQAGLQPYAAHLVSATGPSGRIATTSSGRR
jgi:hypothetical protein